MVCAPAPGVSPASRPSPGTPSSPTALTSGLKTPVLGAPSAPSNPLANILSKVEITPESILSALSKTQTQTAPALQGMGWVLGGGLGVSEGSETCCSAFPKVRTEGEKPHWNVCQVAQVSRTVRAVPSLCSLLVLWPKRTYLERSQSRADQELSVFSACRKLPRGSASSLAPSQGHLASRAGFPLLAAGQDEFYRHDSMV